MEIKGRSIHRAYSIEMRPTLNVIAVGVVLVAMAIVGSPLSAQTSHFAQQGPKLVASFGSGYPNFGKSVALSADGNTAIVGAPNDDAGIGGAWAFTRTNGAWTQQGPKLIGAGAIGPASQGQSVALSADGNTAIVAGGSDNFREVGGKYQSDGAAWVFTRNAGVWMQQGAKLVCPSAVRGASQIRSVALSADGNTAIVGGYDLFDSPDVGGAWVFTRNAGVWTQQGPKLVGTGAIGNVLQGSSVALSADGNIAIVGGAGDDGSAGAAWVFTRRGGVWKQQGDKLHGTGAIDEPDRPTLIVGPHHPGGGQGHSVALSADGNTAIIGGPWDTWPGAAWVFTRTGNLWSQQGNKLVGSGSVASGGLHGRAIMQGSSVALSGDGNTAIVGGPDDDAYAGAAWVFTRIDGVWSQSGPKLTGSDAVRGTAQGAVKGSLQGESVALSADASTAIVGGLGDSNVGAAWVYTMKTSRSSDTSPSSPKWADLPAPEAQASMLEPQRAKDFALSLQGLWSRPNSEMLAALDALYEDEVMYFGKKTSREAVLKEKRAFATRFPQREYKPKEPISVWCGDDSCMVHGLVDFRAVDPVARIVSSGIATFEYQFLMLRPKPKIKMENGDVLSRTRAPLSPTSATR
jgi:FG-GAP repeat